MVRGIGIFSGLALGLIILAGPVMAAPLSPIFAPAAPAEPTDTADPALLLDPLTSDGPEIALFTLEEATIPFLGPDEEQATKVEIAIVAPGYEDLFTVYFPRGTAHLTLPAEDMIAMAAEAVRNYAEAEIWVSAGPALTPVLAFDRMSAVHEILLLNDVPDTWINVDDGSLDAILNRPSDLADDTDI